MKKKSLFIFKSILSKQPLFFHLVLIFSFAIISINAKGEKSAPEAGLTQNRLLVSGIVTDSKGIALPGVSILEKGTTNGTISDIEGKYKINVPANAILVFSFIGMETLESVVNNQTTINITLNPGILSLDDVIIVGYGTLKSRQVSTSITRVTSSDIVDRPVARIDQAIQGKIAGIQVQEISGSPGRSLNVKVRGIGSINYATTPLYVVDGFPISGDLNNINPGDIESIEVLKDAAAASIYGSRGASGVILVSTKNGSKGKAVLELDSYYGIQNRFSKVDVLNRDEYIQYAIEERTNSYIYSGGNISVPEANRTSATFGIDPLWRSDPNSFPDNDWQDLIDRTAPIQSHTISGSGGTDKIKYFISTNYFDQQGIINETYYKRYSTRANVESVLNKIVTLGLNVSFSNSSRNDPDTDTNGGPVSRSILMAPIVGINQQTVDGGYYLYHASFFINPIVWTKELTNKISNNNIMSNFYAELNLMKNLKFRSSFGSNISTYKTDYYLTNNVNRGGGSIGKVTNTLLQNYLNENTLTYDLIKDDWTLNLLGGFTYQEETYEDSFLQKTGFPDDDIKTLNAGTVLSSGTSSATKWSMLSYLSRINLSFRDKYIMTASIRRDGSSRFGEDNRWGYFPSASLGWIISEETFMDNVKQQVSNLKLRASYGTVGNNNIDNYSSIGLMKSSNYIVGGIKTGGYAPSTLGNNILGWEKTSTIDAGIDVGFIKNRVNLTFDYYIANTRDLLLQVQVPEVTGFSTALQNVGEVQNKGLEIELLTKNLVGKFSWTTSFNFSHNKNEVLKLGQDGSPIIGYASGYPITITRIGDPIGSYYLYETDGVFKNQADVDANKALAYVSTHPSPGDLKYKDQNNDGAITVADKVIVGHNNPDSFWGFTNNFYFQGFDLSVFMDGQVGNQLINMAKAQTTQSRANVRGYWRDRWVSEDNPGNGIVPRAVVTENLVTPSSWWLEDASFWRVRSISFGYALPQKLISKINVISKIRLYGSIDNVFMSDHYNHMSQTATFNNSNLTPGLDFDSGYPLATTYIFGLNVKF